MRVSWGDVRYPALVDPAWTATGNLSLTRGDHAAAVLSATKVLVAGGFNGAFLSSCELYDVPTGTWASMRVPSPIMQGSST